VIDFRIRSFFLLAIFHADEYRSSRFYIEDIIIFSSLWGGFFFLRASMEVDDIDMVESLEEMPSHTSESHIIEIAMVRDEGEDSFTIFLYEGLTEAKKLHIVISEPVFALTEVYTVDVFVVFDFFRDPFSFIGRYTAIGRIPDDDHHGLISLHLIRSDRLFGDRVHEPDVKYILLYVGVRLWLFEGVREIYLEWTLEISSSSLSKYESELHMCDRIARHHELESMKSREEITIDIVRPHRSTHTHLRMDIGDDLVQECPRPSRRIEYLDSVDLSLFGKYFLSLIISLLDSLHSYLRAISDAVRESEVSDEDIIDRSYDELHDWSWRIEYSPLHP
jgi:hypothetical protein